MRFGRTLPPATAPIAWSNIVSAAFSLLFPRRDDEKVFEKELKTHFGAKYCYLLSSGKAAFTVILRALHTIYPERDEVFIPAFTCYSVPASIKKAGMKVKLCDMTSQSFDFDLESLEEKISVSRQKNSPLGITATHFYGCPADLEALKSLARDQVIIVEDAAQSMGEQNHGQLLGTISDVGFFSLGRGKPYSVVEGGIIVTN